MSRLGKIKVISYIVADQHTKAGTSETILSIKSLNSLMGYFQVEYSLFGNIS